jgi:general secretion pathway protein D
MRRLSRSVWAGPIATLAVLAMGVNGALATPGMYPGQTGYMSEPSSQQPVTLIGLTATPGKKGETRLELSFSGAPPSYTMLSDDADKPALAFAATTRGTSATFATRTDGLLQGVDFDQRNSALVLNFKVSSAAKVKVTPGGPRSLYVTFTGGAPEDTAATTQHAPTGSLPHEVDRDQSEDGFEVVLLKYADVSEVVGLLTEGLSVKSNDTFNPQEPNFGSSGLGSSNQGGPPPPATTTTTTDPMAESVDDSVGVDRRLNAIILKGSPEHIARMKAKIAAIDVPVQSVSLETMFVELDETGAKNVGIDFNNTSNQLAVATFQTGSFVPSGFVAPSLGSVTLQAAVYAQVQAGHGRIVSKPRISAQSGGTAKIITGDALPILTSIALSGVNAVSQQVQYVNVGVTLQIAPRVSDDGFVTSHVFCVVSSVTGTSQGYPTISQREAETSATVRDGDTFVIGGLTQESDISSTVKVPGLGNVPVLGSIFAYKSGSRSKTELYIVVTPRVVKRGDALPPPPEMDAPAAQAAPDPAARPSANATPPSIAAPTASDNGLNASETSVPPAAASAGPPPSDHLALAAATPAAPTPPAAAAPSAAAITTPALASTAASPPTAVALATGKARSDTAPALPTPASFVEPSTRGAADAGPADSGAAVQIGSYLTAAQAHKALDESSQKVASELVGKALVVSTGSVRGTTYYRANIVGFASQRDALALCETLKARGVACLVRQLSNATSVRSRQPSDAARAPQLAAAASERG